MKHRWAGKSGTLHIFRSSDLEDSVLTVEG